MLVPSTLADRFDIEREVAAGGMGRIYRARDRQTGALVAVKVLAQESEPRARDRFLREAAVLAEIQHPSIVGYVAHGQTGAGAPYLVMEWLDGEELSGLLERRARESAVARDARSSSSSLQAAVADAGRPPSIDPDSEATVTSAVAWHEHFGAAAPASAMGLLSPAETLLLGRKLAAALSVLHRHGIVHRDIKPSNIFLVDGRIEQLKLLDLGAVWRFDALGRLTRTGHFLGTPRYMAPEQVEAGADLTAATDVWALGVVLYQCLAGDTPFRGHGMAPLLASIVLAEPPPIQELRPDVPRGLCESIMAMLHKEPGRRPANGGAICALLDPLTTGEFAVGGAAVPVVQGRRFSTLTDDESRLTCILFASARERSLPPEVLQYAAEGFHGRVHRLVDGTALITVVGQHSPTERASLAARIALAINGAAPAVTLVLATSRTEGERLVAQAADGAARIALGTRPGAIRLDEMSASLLETRFHLGREEHGVYLGEERQFPAARLILGRPTRWRGRRRALATLTATFEECVDSEAARAVLVIGTGGMGKSRLCAEFLDAMGRAGSDHEIMFGCGDMARVGSPFSVLVPALRRYLGLLAGESQEVARDKIRARVGHSVSAEEVPLVASFLGAMIGVAFPEDTHPGLKSASVDPGFRNELMKRAWLGFLRAETARRPVLLVIEDLHWGDLPSVEFIDAALFFLRDQPFMVLALARPEVEHLFPRLWHKRDVTELRLHPLSAKESTALVRGALGEDCPAETVASVVDRAGGSPFILEELIRAVAHGSRELPDTVVAIAQERLAMLDGELKRVMRAASIFGEVFWRGAVGALAGAGGALVVDRALRELQERDFILRQASSRFAGQAEFRFEHALVRDAAYSLLTDDDRQTGHALAATWLEEVADEDALAIAEHWVRGGEPERAAVHFCRAAEDALFSGDCRAAIACVERARTAELEPEARGRLHVVHASAANWLGDYAASREQGLQASASVPKGSARWFIAMGHVVVSSYRLGEQERGREMIAQVTGTACEAGAEGHQIVCLCRAGFQEYFDGRLEHGERIRSQVALLAEAADNLDRRSVGQIHSMLSMRGRVRNSWTQATQHARSAARAFYEAGDVHNALIEKMSEAHYLGSMGCHRLSADLAREVLSESQAAGNSHVAVQAKACIGGALIYLDGATPEAESLLDEAMEFHRAAGNLRMQGVVWIRLSELYLVGEQTERAEEAACFALEKLSGSRPMLGAALAHHAITLLAIGRDNAALMQAQRALEIHRDVGGILHGEGLIYYAVVSALVANGCQAEARELAARGAEVLHRAASEIEDVSLRQMFLTGYNNQRLLKALQELDRASGNRSSQG